MSGLPDDFKRLDPEDLRKDILQTPIYAEQGYGSVEALDLGQVKGTYDSVIVAGMGGSGIAGLLLTSYLHDEKIRLIVLSDYFLPKWAGKSTLVVVCSYSGNTEEELNVFKEARRAECSIVVMTAGGKLEEYARVPRLPIIGLPAGFQPRAALAFQFFALLRLLERLRLVESRAKDVMRLKDDLKTQLGVLDKSAQSLSERLIGKTPIVYTSTRFGPVGYRWKCQFNENSKVLALSNVISEMNHNELAGFENVTGSYHCIILRFEDDHRRVQTRMNLTKEIILKKGIPATDIGVRGPTMLSKMFSAVVLGDLVSYYLALRLSTNPSRVDVIEDFKRNLGPFVG